MPRLERSEDVISVRSSVVAHMIHTLCPSIACSLRCSRNFRYQFTHMYAECAPIGMVGHTLILFTNDECHYTIELSFNDERITVALPKHNHMYK